MQIVVLNFALLPYNVFDKAKKFALRNKIFCGALFGITIFSILLTISYMELRKSYKQIEAQKKDLNIIGQQFFKTLIYVSWKHDNLKEDQKFLQPIRAMFQQLEDTSIRKKYFWLRGFSFGKSSNVKEQEKGIQDYTNIIKNKPDNAVAYNIRGNLYYDIKKYQKALADYNKAIAINPNYAAAYNNRGGIYYDQKKYEKALQDFNKSISLYPKFSGSFCNRGRLYKNIGKHKKALKDLNKAIALDPGYADAYVFRGELHFDLKKYKEAISDWQQAIKLKPQYSKRLQSYINKAKQS